MEKYLIVLTNEVTTKTVLKSFPTDASVRRFAETTQKNPGKYGRVVRASREGKQVYPTLDNDTDAAKEDK